MGLRLRILWLILQGALAAPARYFERRTAARRQHELALAQLQADAQARVLEAIGRSNTEMVRELAGAMSAQANVLHTWLEGFKTVQVPAARVIDENTELGWESDAAREVLERERLETAELLKSALPGALPSLPAELASIPWDSADGRVAPPIAPVDVFEI
jgi:hypothetical protein